MLLWSCFIRDSFCRRFRGFLFFGHSFLLYQMCRRCWRRRFRMLLIEWRQQFKFIVISGTWGGICTNKFRETDCALVKVWQPCFPTQKHHALWRPKSFLILFRVKTTYSRLQTNVPNSFTQKGCFTIEFSEKSKEAEDKLLLLLANERHACLLTLWPGYQVAMSKKGHINRKIKPNTR